MKVSVSSKGYVLSGISPTELNTVMFLLGTLKDRCFREQEDDGSSYDGGDFVATLNREELRALHRFVDGFWYEYEKMRAKLSLTNGQ